MGADTLEKGFVHLYTGHGKGKTTAALGLAMRAAGSGLRTHFIQFMKGQHYGELDAAKMLGGLVTIEQHGSAEFCVTEGQDAKEHYLHARNAIARAREAIHYGTIDILVLDEIVTACLFKLVTLGEILELVHTRPTGKELVLTGRGAPQELIDACDLVTEMKEVKHYYAAGVQGRRGIEY
ncbi:MAG: cob(I)yrinic acid a,c-diamide adenosyltransferase [Spirochaetes bacterium]|nr:MAG: cob(I)yrinic acid a,c-diamide adenosyltransferase [Spirochaetota bacterium]